MNPNAPVVEDATKRAFGAHSAVERRMPYQPTRPRRLSTPLCHPTERRNPEAKHETESPLPRPFPSPFQRGDTEGFPG